MCKEANTEKNRKGVGEFWFWKGVGQIIEALRGWFSVVW
jgi:hypothetical protein